MRARYVIWFIIGLIVLASTFEVFNFRTGEFGNTHDDGEFSVRLLAVVFFILLFSLIRWGFKPEDSRNQIFPLRTLPANRRKIQIVRIVIAITSCVGIIASCVIQRPDIALGFFSVGLLSILLLGFYVSKAIRANRE